ncbi:MAG: hypothetical protein JNL17_00600 [Cyclobacteriaceae bacterium]|nr:hypothetical protein [Cyclobacteriaceae bacterium]
MNWRQVTCGVAVILSLEACATYYQSNQTFNQQFETGDLEKALLTLQGQSHEARGKKEFLYFVNKGLVLSLLGRYEESNEFLERAYLFGEDYRKNYLNEAAAYLTNPTITQYRGEDHEHLFVLYYKALNFAKMGKTDEALVECRRLNIRAQQLADRYSSPQKFQRDAFVHTLMGILYETDRDYNNAFIAYRQAVEIYEQDYEPLFQQSMPEQLKLDVLRTATLNGFEDEVAFYKEKFNLPDYSFTPPAHGELIFFWHNGLAPIKTEWGVTFIITRRDNMAYITNAELGLTFPFSLDGYSDEDKQGLSSLEFFRVAFPRYLERPTFFRGATLDHQGEVYHLQLLENVNKIAFKGLEQRMGLEFSKALIRVALKKAAEYQVRKEDKMLGSILSAINTATERADTRNWQTLPHSIYYSRLPLGEGKNTVSLTLDGMQGEVVHQFVYEGRPGQILFHTFSSLESRFPAYY